MSKTEEEEKSQSYKADIYLQELSDYYFIYVFWFSQMIPVANPQVL